MSKKEETGIAGWGVWGGLFLRAMDKEFHLILK
jgi:hypothetical protein